MNVRCPKMWLCSGLTLGALMMGLSMTSCATVTPLHTAAMRGDLAAIEASVREGISVNARDGDGNTPLHYAVYYQHHEAMVRLMDLGADIHITNKNGATPDEMLDVRYYDDHSSY